MSRKTKSKLITSLLEILLFVCISFIIIVPLLIMILGSFKDATEVTAFNLELPKQWLFENYVTVFEEADLITAFFNGILITVVSTAITIGVSSLAAFIVARRKTSLSRFLYYFFLSALSFLCRPFPPSGFSARWEFTAAIRTPSYYMWPSIFLLAAFCIQGLSRESPKLLTRPLLLTELRQ